jgi:hypothetical protein
MNYNKKSYCLEQNIHNILVTIFKTKSDEIQAELTS